MNISGNLIGLTPKERPDGQVIEIKIIIPFDLNDLANLGAVFGQPVAVDIHELQGSLKFSEEGGDTK